MSDTLVSLQQVTKRYGRQAVLQVDALAMKARERVMVCGHNGSGKSTLLRVLAGISSPNRGHVRWTCTTQPRIGFVPQSGGLYPDISVRENIRIRRRLFGLPAEAPRDRWYITDLGLTELLDRPVATLSGGCQRLAALAAALDGEPTALFVDEPLSGVDERRSGILMQGLNALSPQLELLVLSSPCREEGWILDREISMTAGRIVSDGSH